ncbi:dual specificity protein phosphatase [Trichoderma reesei QM6a]|uniref:protein-tyrosine-phosphatase n=2 Tax=Hypocrea jecorina TaxID=51453 RepID=G0R811_HYPJQ|nr:dual specificity protein phosphatase [Trichoderma reesei QM6a]EGR52289.1 dual specificity protein phosphatase [Trichoderma reesei QM6a]ETS06522.1 DSPc-domain-containing protein [Trichoderma reesei RUT C-30]
MPSAAARQIYEDQIPTFMSVYDLESEAMADRDTFTVVGSKFLEVAPKSSSQPHLQACLAPDQSHKHRDSTSTQTSESDDSSPTTTLSTTDSSPLSDPSPSSSPDSPLNLLPLGNFHSASFSGPSNPVSLLSISEASALERPMTSPAPRKPRNMKGLSIQPPTAAASSKSMVSKPCSPSFIKPSIPAMKRKPSLLSLKTNASDLIKQTSLEVPASPGMPPILQRRALKHSTSSPSFPSSTSLKTATFGPAGGMTFPKVLERNESGLSEFLRPMKSSMNLTFDAAITEEDTPIKTQLASRNDFDDPFREHENNEDQKSPGYPDGPIAIYGDNVYLYLEPTAEEASRFDVVINVAHEVRNPFEAKRISSNLSPIPDTAASNSSFATAWEFQPSDGSSPMDTDMLTPTTPKANPLRRPEYIHIPWDHNTDIAPDLMRLCETIENRTKEGKKVLVHCQQGASRSASLIIAYGLYQNPDFSVNDAYHAAQAKSRWISPNMKLMYSLQDFQKELSKKKRSPPGSGPYRPRSGRSPSKHRLTLSADAIEMPSKEPHTAPLPAENGKGRQGSESTTPLSLHPGNPNDLETISPGPASAPLTFSWRDSFEKPQAERMEPEHKKAKQMEPIINEPEPSPRQSRTDFHPPPSPSPFKLQAPPLRPKLKPTASYSTLGARDYSSSFPMHSSNDKAVHFSAIFPDDALMSPRDQEMANNSTGGFPSIAGMRFIERQELPQNLFSPRQTAFSRDSFFSFGRPTQTADPRSPPAKGEASIIRSIDDIL